MIRFHKSVMVYKNIKAPKRVAMPTIVVLYGETGAGKSHIVHELYDNSLYCCPPKKGSGTYWDGYDHQTTVFIDEMYGARFSHSFLLQLLDKYSLQVPYHGGQFNFNSPLIVMASNSHPREWYSSYYERIGGDFDDGPLNRRLTGPGCGIIYCSHDGMPLADRIYSKILEAGSYEGPLLGEGGEVAPPPQVPLVRVLGHSSNYIPTE